MRDAEDNELHVPEHFAKVPLLTRIRVRLAGALLLSGPCHARVLALVIVARCQVMAEHLIPVSWCLYQFMRYSGKALLRICCGLFVACCPARLPN